MDTGKLIVVLLIAAVVWLVIGIMRSRRKAWEKLEARKKAHYEETARQDAELRKVTIEASQKVAAAQVAYSLMQAKAKQAALDGEIMLAKKAVDQQMLLNRQQFDAMVKASKIRYNPMKDQYEDQHGNLVPEPRKRPGMDMKGADRTFFNPDSFGVAIQNPALVGARISTIQHNDEDEQDARRRRAVESAMLDAQISGLGVVRVSDGGKTVEHIPEATYRGGGGSFDGGGASGDYTPAASSCSSSSGSSDSGSSSSCSSSSDSGSSPSD